MLTRRQMLKRTALLASLGQLSRQQLFANEVKKICRIGACDWSIGKNSNGEHGLGKK